MANLQNATRLQYQEDVRVDNGIQPVICIKFSKISTMLALTTSLFSPLLSLSTFLPVCNHQYRGGGETLANGSLNLFEGKKMEEE